MKKLMLLLVLVATVATLVLLIVNAQSMVHNHEIIPLIGFGVIAITLIGMCWSIYDDTKKSPRSLPVNITGNIKCDIIDDCTNTVLYTQGAFIHIIGIRVDPTFTCGLSIITSTNEVLSMELISEIDNIKVEV